MDTYTRALRARPKAADADSESRRNGGETLSGSELSFLLEATRLLAKSLNVETTLATVARLALPHFGSWCIVDLCEGGDHPTRVAIIHPDAERQALADRLLSGWPPQRDDPFGVPSVVKTGRSDFVLRVTDEMLEAAAGSDENLEILRFLEIGSILSVPLVARGRVLGAITYISPNHGNSFSQHDLVVAEDLAGRCATAIDNARLLESVHKARDEAEAARHMAESANRAKMRFLSMMSHELRTPLNAIAAYAELLETGLRGPLTPEQLADVQRIHANERQLLSLVESVLDYAKIDAGRIEYLLEDVPLADVLIDVGATVAPLAKDRGVICLGCDGMPDDGTLLYADGNKLRQLLARLITNSIKFSARGSEVHVSHEVVGNEVEIRVSDRGVGIAPEHRERIFEPFVQAEEGMSRRHGGTGLGLAISRELAAGMGGSLSVESEPGEGSTFMLRLPQGRG
jgi:signal transduction histidine kinase